MSQVTFSVSVDQDIQTFGAKYDEYLADHAYYDDIRGNNTDAVNFVLDYFFPDLSQGYAKKETLCCTPGNIPRKNCFDGGDIALVKPSPGFFMTNPDYVFDKARFINKAMQGIKSRAEKENQQLITSLFPFFAARKNKSADVLLQPPQAMRME